MKRLKRFFAVLMVFALLAAVFAGCETQEAKIYERVYAHLHEKYKGVDFQINGYTQNTETSGRYILDITCLTTGVDFQMTMSSLLVSDSYFVSHANDRLRSDIYEALGFDPKSIYIEDVQCFDLYISESDTVRFNENVELSTISLDELKEIYRVYLVDVPSSNDAAQCIYFFCDILELEDYTFDKISFDFKLGKEHVRVETSTDAINTSSIAEIERLLDDAKSPSALGNIFYRDPESDVKVIPYFGK